MIRAAGRVPVRRNTIYEVRDIYDDHDPEDLAPLVDRRGRNPLDFLQMFPERSTTLEAAE